MVCAVPEHRKPRISVRRCLALTQGLLVTALAVIASVSWVAIEDSNMFAQELALVSRGQRYHQQSDAVQDALRADVNAALAFESTNPDAAEVILASMRADAARFTAALDSLRQLNLPIDLAQRVASTRSLADA